jgi:hypothetical protein
MNRLAGIIIAVIGLVVAVLGFLKILPGMTQTGIVLFLFGLLIIGLSFIPKPEGKDTGPMSTPATLVNIFFSPTEVFQSLRSNPRWLVALLVMSILGTVFTNAFIYRLTSERIVNYTIDKTKEASWIPEETKKEIEKGRASAIEQNKDPLMRATTAVTGFAGYVFWIAFVSLLFFVFILALGGKLNYWQAFAAATYAAFPISVIRSVLGSIILFIKDPDTIHPILGQSALIQDNLNFLANPATNPVLYTLLGAFGILSFYWIWLMKTGLENTGEKVTSTMAWTAVLALWFVGICLMVVSAMFFGNFMS